MWRDVISLVIHS